MTDTTELRRLMEAATPGEWLDTGNGFVRQGRTKAPIASIYGDREDCHQDERMSANAALIVAMRNALPELLKALEALQQIENTACEGLDTGETREALIDIKYAARRALTPHGGVE